MKQFVFLAICFMCIQTGFSQQKNPATNSYEYFIEINGLFSKSIIKVFDASISSKNEVVGFSGYKIPRSFYILRTRIPVSREKFQSWLSNPAYILKTYKPGVFSADFIINKKNQNNRSGKTDKSGTGL